jgi:hypothetical protein
MENLAQLLLLLITKTKVLLQENPMRVEEAFSLSLKECLVKQMIQINLRFHTEEEFHNKQRHQALKVLHLLLKIKKALTAGVLKKH